MVYNTAEFVYKNTVNLGTNGIFSFIGVKAPDHPTQMEQMDIVCYEKVLKFVRDGHQVGFGCNYQNFRVVR